MISYKDSMRVMNRAVRRAKDSLFESGALFPMLLMYKKGEPIYVEETKDDIKGCVSIKVVSDAEPTSPEFIAEDNQQIYLSCFVFKYGEGIDETDIDNAAKKLAKKYKPDMIGLVMSCLYLQKVEDLPVHMDPDNTRILHSVYYTPNERVGKVLFMPFVNRGELPLGKRTVSPTGEDEINYDMFFVESPWVFSNARDNIDPLISNPFYGR